MPSQNPIIKQGLKSGHITRKQYDKLPDKLLVGIINKKKGGGPAKKPMKKPCKGKHKCK